MYMSAGFVGNDARYVVTGVHVARYVAIGLGIWECCTLIARGREITSTQQGRPNSPFEFYFLEESRKRPRTSAFLSYML